MGFDKRAKDSMPVPDRSRVTIHLDEGEPEIGWSRVTFTRQKGVFSEAVLRAVKAKTENVACFSGGDHAKISVVTKRDFKYPRLAQAALRVLKACYPNATFTTYVNSTKRTFGVQQIRSR